MDRTTPDSTTEEPRWIKSSYSGPGGNECVEISGAGTGVGIRDSKAPQGPVLRFSPEAFASFVSGLKERRGV
ncbi:DUF397 domain-containing protein [Streptomyces daliensis]|uniref:DUF397 domain-containing protein n=1 Tax=Streptomyces daliensis TaxID=299421 RepID=A0A8T4J2I5_9ACTN|nr:DUF397 domain-containing protein [Streptomyces daliensis]